MWSQTPISRVVLTNPNLGSRKFPVQVAINCKCKNILYTSKSNLERLLTPLQHFYRLFVWFFFFAPHFLLLLSMCEL